jgi:hypothetical protein
MAEIAASASANARMNLVSIAVLLALKPEAASANQIEERRIYSRTCFEYLYEVRIRKTVT